MDDERETLLAEIAERQARESVRPIRIEGDVAYITLTKGCETVIDVADVPLVRGRNWFVEIKDRNRYAKTVIKAGDKKVHIRLHRVLLDVPSDLYVDHIDGDGLNNRRSNLRLATNSQNQFNQRMRADNKSGYRGVHWANQHQKWIASIKVQGKRRHLGCFKTAEEAHAAYCEASKRLHGEYGRVA